MKKSFEDFKQLFISKNCILHLTEPVYHTLKDVNKTKIKITSSCGHESNIHFINFMYKGTGILCKKCKIDENKKKLINKPKLSNDFSNSGIIEYESTQYLYKLIQSDLLQTTSWKAGAMTFENEKQQLQQLRKNIKNNKLKTVYKKAKYGYGRVYPQKSLSLCSIRKQIRHTLSFHQYVGIDVVNCHPELLLQICEHNNIKTKYLKQYVENRDSILVDVQREYKCDRDQAKLLFIIFLG